jgi:hypothetical protein
MGNGSRVTLRIGFRNSGATRDISMGDLWRADGGCVAVLLSFVESCNFCIASSVLLRERSKSIRTVMPSAARTSAARLMSFDFDRDFLNLDFLLRSNMANVIMRASA